jgi:hypothetical protein
MPTRWAAVAEVAQRFGWSRNWTRDVTSAGLALLCLWAGKTLWELDDAHFVRFAAELAVTSDPPTSCSWNAAAG